MMSKNIELPFFMATCTTGFAKIRMKYESGFVSQVSVYPAMQLSAALREMIFVDSISSILALIVLESAGMFASWR